MIVLNYMKSVKNVINEFLRKSIHLASSFIPVSYIFLERSSMIAYLSFVFVVCVIFDLARISHPKINLIFMHFFSRLIRDFESRTLLGSTYFLSGCLITVIFFEKNIAIISMLILIFCDTVACFAGKTFKSKKIVGEKTIAGFCGFLTSALIISFLYSYFLNFNFSLFIIPSITSSIAELYSKKLKIDDNFLIPISFALCLTI